MTTIEGAYVPNTQDWVRDQVETYERSGGAEARTFGDSGLPIIVLTMRGARTGHVHKTALMRTEHKGSYALVAGAGGAPNSPGWYYNIIANPSEVFIQDGPVPFRVTVHEVSGDERALWWERAIAAFPGYIERQAKTSRVFPVLVASPQ